MGGRRVATACNRKDQTNAQPELRRTRFEPACKHYSVASKRAQGFPSPCLQRLQRTRTDLGLLEQGVHGHHDTEVIFGMSPTLADTKPLSIWARKRGAGATDFSRLQSDRIRREVRA